MNTATTPRKQTPPSAKASALRSDLTPLYAVAGLTDALVTAVRERQVKLTGDEVARILRSVPDQVRTLPEVTRARLAEMQKQAQDYVAEANRSYAELAGRGKRVVDETIMTARQLSDRAERRAEVVLADAADAVDPAFEKVQETVTVARKTVTGRNATQTVTPRSAAKASTARSVAAEKAAAEKAAAEKAAADRATRRKAAAKKAVATRAAEKLAAEERAAAEQAAADKAEAQKAAAVKAAVKATEKAAQKEAAEKAAEAKEAEAKAAEAKAAEAKAAEAKGTEAKGTEKATS